MTSELAGGEWSVSRHGRFTPRERVPGTNWIEGWVKPRAGLDDLERVKFLTLSGLELRPLHHAARSQSLYRLRCKEEDENCPVLFRRIARMWWGSSVMDPYIHKLGMELRWVVASRSGRFTSRNSFCERIE
jgi:hypothetical protein